MTGYTSRYALADYTADALLAEFSAIYTPAPAVPDQPQSAHEASAEDRAVLGTVTEHASGGFAFVGDAVREAGVDPSAGRVEKVRGEEAPGGDAVRWASAEAKAAYAPRFNINPGKQCVVARIDTSSPREPVIFDCLRWGLIPHWNEKRGRPPSYARDESIASGIGMWKEIRQTKRCLIFAQGFYEWLVKGKERTPYYTKRKDGGLMVMAGLWDRATPPGTGETIESFSIVTTRSSKEVEFLSEKMPLILTDPVEMRLWMGGERWSEALVKVMRPFEGELDCYRVSPAVNDPDAESPDLVKRYGAKQGGLATLFAKQTSSPTQPPPPRPQPSLAQPALSLTSPLTPNAPSAHSDKSSPATSLFGSARKSTAATANATTPSRKRASSPARSDGSEVEVISSPARPAKKSKQVPEGKKKGQAGIMGFLVKKGAEAGAKENEPVEVLELSD